MSEINLRLFFPLAWLIIGHTIAVIVIYNFGFTASTNEKEENADIYRYMRLFQPFFRKPFPDPEAKSNFYTRCKKFISILLITCETLATVTITILLVK